MSLSTLSSLSTDAVAGLVRLSAEAAHGEGGLPAWVVGGGILLILFGLMAALLAFGRGREHC